MECLRDYIGNRWCGATAPPSGLYIQDLEGISLKSITSLADAQQANFTGVYADIQTRALLRLGDDFKALMGRRKKIRNVIDTISLPASNINVDSTDIDSYTADDHVGIKVSIDYGIDEKYTASPLAGIYVQNLWVYLPGSVTGDTVTVRIRDLDNATLPADWLWETTITAADGWNKVEVNQTFTNDIFDKSRNLFCGYYVTTDNGTVPPVYYTIPDTHNDGTCCEMRIVGAKLADDLTLTESDQSWGVAATIAVRCSWDSFVCSNKDLFRRPLLYALGVETMREQMYSERLNEFTTIRANKAAELLEKFTADYNAALAATVEGIDVDCDCCVECGGSYSYSIAETV